MPWPPRRGSPAAPSDAVRSPLDGRDATEEEVASGPGAHVVLPFCETGGDGVRPPSLDVHRLAVDVESRARDRLGDRQTMADDPRDDLEDRSGEPNRARASGDQPRLPLLVEHERRRHHAREPRPRLPRLEPDHVSLTQHVVQLEAVTEDAGAGAEGRRETDGGAVRVDDGDVRGSGRPCSRAVRRRTRRRAPASAHAPRRSIRRAPSASRRARRGRPGRRRHRATAEASSVPSRPRSFPAAACAPRRDRRRDRPRDG